MITIGYFFVILRQKTHPGEGYGEEVRQGRRNGYVRGTKHGGRQTQASVNQHGGVSGQVPVCRVPSDTELGRAMLLRVLGRSHVQLEHATSHFRTQGRATRPGH